MFRSSILAVFVLAAGFVAAQDPSASSSAPVPSGTPSTCVTDCATTAAASAGCTGITDVQCVCTNIAFQEATLTCITTNCPDQAAAAAALQEQICGSLVPSGSSAPATSAPATSAPGTSAPGSSAPTSRPASSSGPAPSGSATPSGSANTSRSSAPAATTTGAAFKNAPVAGAMGALAALVGAAVF